MKTWGLLLGLFVFLLAGCQNPITDVGNPKDVNAVPSSEEQKVPSTQELIGSYGSSTASSNATGGSSDQPSSAPSLPSCQSDSKVVKSISAGAKSNQIILNNFMNYSASTKQITATYEDGDLFFDVIDSTVDIGCDGTATFSGSNIVINLTCDLLKPTKTTCSIFYVKQ